MNITDAMREADRRGMPVIRGQFYPVLPRDWEGEQCPTCAISAANLVAGNGSLRVVTETYWDTPFPVTREDGVVQSCELFDDAKELGIGSVIITRKALRRQCPICDASCWGQNIITHLFDIHTWSRTQIADWLDSLKVKPE